MQSQYTDRFINEEVVNQVSETILNYNGKNQHIYTIEYQ